MRDVSGTCDMENRLSVCICHERHSSGCHLLLPATAGEQRRPRGHFTRVQVPSVSRALLGLSHLNYSALLSALRGRLGGSGGEEEPVEPARHLRAARTPQRHGGCLAAGERRRREAEESQRCASCRPSWLDRGAISATSPRLLPRLPHRRRHSAQRVAAVRVAHDRGDGSDVPSAPTHSECGCAKGEV